jgi:hypothetical protein
MLCSSAGGLNDDYREYERGIYESYVDSGVTECGVCAGY